MANYKLTDTDLTAVANAIRAKGGTSSQLEWPSGYISAIQAIDTGIPDIVPWSTGTDEEIVALIQAAHEGKIDLQQDAGWAVGDTRTISVGAFTSYYWNGTPTISAQNIDIVISSFNDYNSCGCVLQFDFKNSFNGDSAIIPPNQEYTGYGTSVMKTQILPNLVNALPTWLKDSLIEFSVLTAQSTRSGTIESVNGNKLALRSEVEITGSNSKSFSGEGSQIDYYLTSSNRVKKKGSSNDRWFLRSPFNAPPNALSSAYQSCVCINNDGSVRDYSASNGYGMSPFGCI